MHKAAGIFNKRSGSRQESGGKTGAEKKERGVFGRGRKTITGARSKKSTHELLGFLGGQRDEWPQLLKFSWAD